MAKPIIKTFAAPDATKPFTIGFVWNGERAYYNRVVISDNKTNTVKYDQKIETYNLYQTIAANSLTNGGTWIVQVSVFYRNPSNTTEFIESELSDKILFVTRTTPTFSFADLDPTGENKVDAANYQASIAYYSKENEPITDYYFYLYDASKKFLFKSDRFTDQSNLTYTFRSLDNMTNYFIRCQAITHHGIELDTGLVMIHVKYMNPSTYSRIYATPIPDRGCIEVGSNLIVIQYNGEGNFKYNDSQIILTDGQKLYYDEGWKILDDFTIILKMQYMEYGEVFRITNGVNDITLTARIYADGKTRFKLKATNGLNNYILYSSAEAINYEDKIVVGIHRKGDVFALKVLTDNSESTGDYWWGINVPTTAEGYDKWIDTEDNPTVHSLYDTLTETINDTEPTNGLNNDIWLSKN